MKLSLVLGCLVSCLFSQAQEKESFYVFNATWKPTVIDSAKFLLVIHQKEDENWEWNYYDLWGPMIRMETFKDHDGSLLNGRTCYYTDEGDLDSIGRYELGKKEGSFYKLDTRGHDSIRWITEYVYHQDSLEETIDLLADSNRQKALQKDSINNKESEYVGGLKACSTSC